MTRWLALVSSELRQRRLLLAGSALLGLLALVAPALPSLAGRDPAEVRAATALALFAVWTPLLALIAGATAVGGELADRRIGFYLARPLSTWTVWGGKLGAAVLLPLLAALLVLLPAALAGGIFSIVGSPTERFSDLPFLSGAAIAGILALVALGHAAGIALRSRSVWLLVDLAAIALGAALVAEAVGVLTRAFVPLAAAAGAVALACFAIVALAAAGALAVHRGRAELKAAHRALSLALWPAVLAGAFGFVLFARWIVAAPITSLVGGGTAWAPPGSSEWAVVGGEAEHRFGFRAAFLLEPATGRTLSLGSAAGRTLPLEWAPPFPLIVPAFAEDGSRAVWPGPGGEDFEVWSLDLARRGAEPEPTRIAVRHGTRWLALSPDGRQVAVLERDRLLVSALAGGKLVAVMRLDDVLFDRRVQFLDADRLRLVRLNFMRRESRFEVVDVAQRGGRPEAYPPFAAPPGYSFWQVNRAGDRLLARVGVDIGAGPAALRLYALPSGVLLTDFGDRPAGESAFLADGRIAVSEATPGGQVLRVVSRGGGVEGEFRFPAAGWLDLGGQPQAGTIVIATGKRAGQARTHPPTAHLLDLASGRLQVLGEGLTPVAHPGTLGRLARLFREADGALVEVGERGERRVVLRRPG